MWLLLPLRNGPARLPRLAKAAVRVPRPHRRRVQMADALVVQLGAGDSGLAELAVQVIAAHDIQDAVLHRLGSILQQDRRRLASVAIVRRLCPSSEAALLGLVDLLHRVAVLLGDQFNMEEDPESRKALVYLDHVGACIQQAAQGALTHSVLARMVAYLDNSTQSRLHTLPERLAAYTRATLLQCIAHLFAESISAAQRSRESLAAQLSDAQERRYQQGLDPDDGRAQRLSAVEADVAALHGTLLSLVQDFLFSSNAHLVAAAVALTKALSNCRLYPRVICQQLSAYLQPSQEKKGQLLALRVVARLVFKPHAALELALPWLQSGDTDLRRCALLGLLELMRAGAFGEDSIFTILNDVLLNVISELAASMLISDDGLPTLTSLGLPGRPPASRRATFEFLACARIFGHDNVNNAIIELSSEVRPAFLSSRLFPQRGAAVGAPRCMQVWSVGLWVGGSVGRWVAALDGAGRGVAGGGSVPPPGAPPRYFQRPATGPHCTRRYCPLRRNAAAPSQPTKATLWHGHGCGCWEDFQAELSHAQFFVYEQLCAVAQKEALGNPRLPASLALLVDGLRALPVRSSAAACLQR